MLMVDVLIYFWSIDAGVVDFLWGESGLVHDFCSGFFEACFLRGFCEIWAVNAVFWWAGCGELSGKRGLLVGGFWGLWILRFFGIYFEGLGGGLGVRFARSANTPPFAIKLQRMGHPRF
jgi:hypothetical protein